MTAVIQEHVAVDHHIISYLHVVPKGKLNELEAFEVLAAGFEDPARQNAP